MQNLRKKVIVTDKEEINPRTKFSLHVPNLYSIIYKYFYISVPEGAGNNEAVMDGIASASKR